MQVRALRASSGAAVGATGVGPGLHALVLGLRGLPQAGDDLVVGGASVWCAVERSVLVGGVLDDLVVGGASVPVLKSWVLANQRSVWVA